MTKTILFAGAFWLLIIGCLIHLGKANAHGSMPIQTCVWPNTCDK